MVAKLSGGQTLALNTRLHSPNDKFTLTMQNDGNLVLYTPDCAVWASNTNGNPGSALHLQDDGNLVIYNNSGTPIWATDTMIVPPSEDWSGTGNNLKLEGDVYFPVWVFEGKVHFTVWPNRKEAKSDFYVEGIWVAGSELDSERLVNESRIPLHLFLELK